MQESLHVKNNEQIILSIKDLVQQVIPDAQVLLFGSRLINAETEESDWDILIVTKQYIVNKKLKNKVHEKIFPLSVEIGSFINFVLVHKTQWLTDPSYYSLRKNLEEQNIIA